MDGGRGASVIELTGGVPAELQCPIGDLNGAAYSLSCIKTRERRTDIRSYVE